MKRHSRRALHCALESLESRQVLSTVSVMPAQVALPSVTHGHGVVTVAVVGDADLDVSTLDPTSLTLTAAASDGTAQVLTLRGTPRVVGTGSDAELILKFTRSQLQQFASQLSGGTLALTIDAQGTISSSSTDGTTTGDGTTTTTTSGDGTTTGSTATDLGSATLTLFQPGHQGHGHSHGPQGGQGQTSGAPTGHGHHGHGRGSSHYQGPGSGTTDGSGTTTGSGGDSTQTDGTTSGSQTSGQDLGAITTEDGGHGNGHGNGHGRHD